MFDKRGLLLIIAPRLESTETIELKIIGKEMKQDSNSYTEKINIL